MALRHPIYDDETEALRAQIRRFCEKEILPHMEAWEEAGEMPRSVYQAAAEAGLLGLSFPEEYGGSGGDILHYCMVREELAATGATGVRVALMAHGIGLPPILNLGSEEMKRRVLPEVLSGDKIAALAISEAEGGSDVASIRTRARRDGDHFVVDGQKMFISNGVRGDYYSVAVRTGGEGMGGISLLLIERDRAGFTQTELPKSGWWTSDTAVLHFDGVRVPVSNLIGAENAGFKGIMANFNLERLGIAASVLGSTRCAYQEAVRYTGARKTFGKFLREHQVVRHKLVDMAMRLQAMEAAVDTTIWKVRQGERCIPEIAMLKNQLTKDHEWVASQAVQVFGGAGIIRGHPVERIFRESKILSIGGGSVEVMKDLAAKQLGF